jgi:polyphenol oxidase
MTRQEAVAAVHAGWRGARAGIVTRTLQSMQDLFGTAPVNCLAYIGPCIDCDSYEVDADVADFFEERYKKWDEEKGKFLLDLKRVNLDQLLAAKIPEKQIEVSPHSTVAHNEDYFSYRAEGPMSGRMVGVIGMIC